ncbi:hypothetical protein G7Y89_g8351 [Cudoniella acicularis]|uniref:Uncharacterized protein n=1 Tax=Cudoniella acicularis TaxID=354080 RepID=A0A8H4RJI4_9HELO|nr:hypothetical protein G7Y89_g8351 [Cudoniella acicularis]
MFIFGGGVGETRLLTAARAWPNCNLPELRILAFFTIWLFMWDDEIDQATGSLTDGYEASSEFRRQTPVYVEQCLELDNYEEERIVPKSVINRTFAEVGDALCAVYDIGQRKLFMSELVYYMEISDLEQRRRLNSEIPTVGDFANGTPPCLALQNARTNDILSLKKEIRFGSIESLIPLATATHGDPQRAIDEAVAYLQDLVVCFEEDCADLLSQSYSDEEMRFIRCFVDGCKISCTGNLNWRLSTYRRLIVTLCTALSACYSQDVYNYTATYTDFTSWEDKKTISMTTLCDGWPRVVRSQTSNVYSIYLTFFDKTWTPYTRSPLVTRTEVRPDFSVDDGSDDCSRLWSEWNTVTSKTDFYEGNDRHRPPCTQPEHACPSAAECYMAAAGTPAVYYWPVTTVSGEFAKQNSTTVTPTPTDYFGRPNTVEYGDMIFTSPSVYMRRTATRNCGPTATAVTLTLDLTDVRTLHGGRYYIDQPHYAVNWTDFNTVPMKAYHRQCSIERLNPKGDHNCNHGETAIYNYSPWFRIPQTMKKETDEWTAWNCSHYREFRPVVVRIEPEMTVSLDEDPWQLHRRKGIKTAMPIATPSRELPRPTDTSSPS